MYFKCFFLYFIFFLFDFLFMGKNKDKYKLYHLNLIN